MAKTIKIDDKHEIERMLTSGEVKYLHSNNTDGTMIRYYIAPDGTIYYHTPQPSRINPYNYNNQTNDSAGAIYAGLLKKLFHAVMTNNEEELLLSIKAISNAEKRLHHQFSLKIKDEVEREQAFRTAIQTHIETSFQDFVRRTGVNESQLLEKLLERIYTITEFETIYKQLFIRYSDITNIGNESF